MVLPLIPVALGVSALATAVTGLKKAWDAKQNYSKAQDWVDASKRELSEAAESLESRREEVCTQLNAVAMLRMQIISKSIKKFSDLMDQVAGSDFAEINVDGHEIAVEVVPQSELATASYQATDFLQHGIQSAASGAMVGAGVGQAVSMLGVASTGTAISGLSGAAATNATLAWLGGGSLASGGLGIAGGTTVLGGVVAGPVLLVMGYLAAGKSEEALTEARAHSAKLDETIEQLKNVVVMLDAIDQRSQELAWVLDALDERFKAAANRVSRILGKARRDREAIYLDKGKPVPANLAVRKIEYSKLSEKDQNSFAMMVALGSALYQVAKIEILDKKGRITKKSEKMIEEMHQLLEQV